MFETRARDHWMDVAALAFPIFGPLGVLLGIGLVGVPRAIFVCKLQLIDHHDALIDRTNLRELVAARAVLVGNIVQPIGCLIETLVGTLQPTERALGTKIEANNRPLIFRRAALERLVSGLALRAQFELPSNGRNRSAFH